MAKQRMAQDEPAATSCVGAAQPHSRDASTSHHVDTSDGAQLLQEQLRDLQAYKGAYGSSEAKCESFTPRILEMEVGSAALQAKHNQLVQLTRQARIAFFAGHMDVIGKGSADGNDSEPVSWRAAYRSLVAVVQPFCLYED
jgi:hypothetical protein